MVLLLAGLVWGCRSKPALNSALTLPVSGSAPGWVKSGETRSFDASHLWEYIDGDAEKYLQAGVVETLTSDYRLNGKTDATVDVYVMHDAAGARTIYDSESAAGSESLAIGDAARYARGSLTFRQGPYFVRLVAYQDSPETAKALASLAVAVSGKLNG